MEQAGLPFPQSCLPRGTVWNVSVPQPSPVVPTAFILTDLLFNPTEQTLLNTELTIRNKQYLGARRQEGNKTRWLWGQRHRIINLNEWKQIQLSAGESAVYFLRHIWLPPLSLG